VRVRVTFEAVVTTSRGEVDLADPEHPCDGWEGPCDQTMGVTQQGCRTQYVDPELNTSPWLCLVCSEGYHEHWDGMWAEYYSGRL